MNRSDSVFNGFFLRVFAPSWFIFLCFFLCQPFAHALEPDQIALIVNRNVPASVKLAEYYARVRQIPDHRIIALNLPAGEEIPFEKYEREVVPAVQAFLRDGGLENKVTCLVTFYGVPIRIGGKTNTPAEKEELAKLQEELKKIRSQMEATIAAGEKLAAANDPSFQAGQGTELPRLAQRADAALKSIGVQLAKIQDPRQRGQITGPLLRFMESIGGPAELADKFADAEIASPSQSQEEKQKWITLRDRVIKSREELMTLRYQRFDPQARARMREAAMQTLGLFGYAKILDAQIGYFNADDSVAALDSELALLWWGYYSRERWQLNALHYRATPQEAPPTLMVTRLDGPQEGTARDIIVASLKAEKEGLKGRVALDSRGISATEKGKDSAFGPFDQSIRDLAEIVRSRTKLPLTTDDAGNVFPAGSVKDVAIYCGWYSVRKYVPAFTFNPGAVGYHVASFEMLSLRGEKEKGWVAGLLNDGIAATVGPVAEPYLQSFPKPDEFFPLLFTGKLTLAEVYWKTTPMTSWMLGIIGDPLYNPYKANPAISVDDLPTPLQAVFQAPSTAPAR